MMYCGNCEETADASKTKSRQIACERVNAMKNAQTVVERLGPLENTREGCITERKREREVQRFSQARRESEKQGVQAEQR